MGKTGQSRMDMKKVFLAAAMVAGIILIIALVTVRMLYLSSVLCDDIGVSIYGVFVDLVVGVFTIWGLYWAASEFAGAQVRPDLHLVIGREEADQKGVAPLTNEADALIGRDSVPPVLPCSWVVAGLFLENTRPKAARYVKVVVRVRDVPRPESIDMWYGYHTGLVNFRRQGEALSFSFGEDLVVYKGEMTYLTSIKMIWRQGTHPERITFLARLCSLEGEPKEVTVSHPIHWLD